MRILIVRLWPYELNINSYNCQEIGLAKSLIKKGNICDIVLYTNGQSREEDIIVNNKYKIHIYYLKAKNFLKNCLYEKKLYDIIKKYDIVQTAEYDQIANAKLNKILKDKMVVYHGPYESTYNKGYPIKCLISDIYFLFHHNYKKAKFIAKSNLAKKYLIKKGFNNVVTLGVGLDIDRFKKTAENVNNKVIENLKDNYDNYNYLLYVGKLEDRRNIPFLINLVENLKNKNNKIKLIIVGNGEEKYKNCCFNLIKEKKLEDYIVYIKSLKQDEIKELYEICDAFLLPTKYEIFGMVILEAMYFGIPVITTHNGGSDTLIENGKDGFIIDNFNIDDWKIVINSILEDRNFKDTITQNAKCKIENNFTWDALADKFIDVYNKR